MALHAAYKTSLKLGGTSIFSKGELPTKRKVTDDGKFEYAIKDVSKQVLDRDKTVVVKLSDKVLPETSYTVDYLFGIISFNKDPEKGKPVADKLTVTANFIPLGNIVGAHQYSLEYNKDLHDATTFNKNEGYKTRVAGLSDITASLSNYYEVNSIYKDRLKKGTNVLLEIRPNNANEVIRGWFLVESASNSGDVSALETESVQLQMDADPKSSFSWRTI